MDHLSHCAVLWELACLPCCPLSSLGKSVMNYLACDFQSLAESVHISKQVVKSHQ